MTKKQLETQVKKVNELVAELEVLLFRPDTEVGGRGLILKIQADPLALPGNMDKSIEQTHRVRQILTSLLEI